MHKKSYNKPTLTEFQDIRTVTMGSSPGRPETGTGGIFSRIGTGGDSNTTDAGTGSTEGTNEVFPE